MGKLAQWKRTFVLSPRFRAKPLSELELLLQSPVPVQPYAASPEIMTSLAWTS